MINYTRQVGNEAEAHLCYVAQRMGWNLARPYAVDLSYDFAIKRPEDKTWKKVQVKVSAPKRTGANSSVDIRKGKGRSYKPEDFDFLYAYDPATLKAWLIPHKSLSAVRCEFTPSNSPYNKYEVYY